MGLIKAFAGAVGGTLSDQWNDIVGPPSNMTDHVVFAAGVTQGTNNGRGSNTKSSSNVISNGSLIVVPVGTAAIIMEQGGITGVIAEAGGYVFNSDDINSKSVFAGDGLMASLIKQSWERFKFGGQPGTRQMVFYVNLKEIAGLKYGTTNPIRYKDANYGNTMLAVTSFGNYSIKVIDPMALVTNLIPVAALSNGKAFSIEDDGVGETLFSGFIGSLAVALSQYTKGGKGIDDIQGGTVEFAQHIDQAVEETYQWHTKYGLQLVGVQPRGLDWNDKSIELIDKYNTGFMMQGGIGNAYAQTQVAEGMKSAGQSGGTGNMFGMAMVNGQMGGMLQQPVAQQQQQQQQPAQQAPVADDPMAVLQKIKALFDNDLISQEEYDIKKKDILSKM